MARMQIKNKSDSLPTVIRNSKGEEIGHYDEDMIQTLKNTVAVGATDSEFKMFMSLALSYDLDPFKKEIFFGKSEKSDKVLVMISRDGYRKIVKRDSNYKYHVSDYVCENDDFKVTKNDDKISLVHEYGFDRGDLKGAYCILYTNSGEQYSFFAEFNKYNQSSTSLGWRNYPIDMIIKTAESRVFRSFADVNGLIPESDEETVVSEDVIENEIETKIIKEE